MGLAAFPGAGGGADQQADLFAEMGLFVLKELLIGGRVMAPDDAGLIDDYHLREVDGACDPWCRVLVLARLIARSIQGAGRPVRYCQDGNLCTHHRRTPGPA